MMLQDIKLETYMHLVFNKHNENYRETTAYHCWDKRGLLCGSHERNCIWQHIPKALLINDAVKSEPGVIYMDIARTDKVIKGSNPRSRPLLEKLEYLQFKKRNDHRTIGKAGTYYDRWDYGKEWYVWLPPDVLEGTIVPGSISVRLGVPYSTHNR